MKTKKTILRDTLSSYDTTVKKTPGGVTVTRIPKLDSVKNAPSSPVKKIVPEQQTNKPVSNRYGTVVTPTSISRTAPGGLTKEEMINFFQNKRRANN